MLLKLENIGKIYDSNDILTVGIRGIDLAFDYNEFVTIEGESGSGKSTLLNVIGANDTYEEGELYFNGEPTSHYSEADWEKYREKNIATIFQDFNIIENLTVLENVELALLRLDDVKERKKRAKELIARVGLTEQMNRRGSKLSGGEKQRTVIARALAKDAPVILADEPTGNLDVKASKEVAALLKEVSKDKLVIVVTHDKESAEAFGDVVITLKSGRVDEIKRKEAASEGEPSEEAYLAETDAPRAAGRKGRRTYAGKTAVAAFFGRKAKCIVSVILSVLVLLCMEIVLTAQGGTDAEVEARFLESHPDTYSYAYLKIGQKPPLSVS